MSRLDVRRLGASLAIRAAAERLRKVASEIVEDGADFPGEGSTDVRVSKLRDAYRFLEDALVERMESLRDLP